MDTIIISKNYDDENFGYIFHDKDEIGKGYKILTRYTESKIHVIALMKNFGHHYAFVHLDCVNYESNKLDISEKCKLHYGKMAVAALNASFLFARNFKSKIYECPVMIIKEIIKLNYNRMAFITLNEPFLYAKDFNLQHSNILQLQKCNLIPFNKKILDYQNALRIRFFTIECPLCSIKYILCSGLGMIPHTFQLNEKPPLIPLKSRKG